MEEGDEYALEQTYQSGSVCSAATDATDDSEIQVCVYARALAFCVKKPLLCVDLAPENKPMPFVVSRGSLTGPSCMLSVMCDAVWLGAASHCTRDL